MMVRIWRGWGRPALRGINANTALVALLAAALLSACGGGGGGGDNSSAPVSSTVPATPTGLSLGYDVKTFRLSWTAVTPPGTGGPVTYRVTEDPDGAGPQAATQIATDLTAPSYARQVTGLLTTRLNATYTVQACNNAGCSPLAAPVVVDVKQAVGFFRASNTNVQTSNNFGDSVALSADGTTLAVGAPGESSNATGINGDQTNTSARNAGAVFVFTRSAGVWSQQAYVKASNAREYAFFGSSMALSADGNTLVVGATGVFYVFTRNGTAWSQQANVEGFGGQSVALSADGATLAVGAYGEASAATGINGDPTNTSAPNSGAVFVFTRSAGVWSQQAYVKASNTGENDNFGNSVALSADGATLAVGARFESSNATGINGDQSNNSANGAGAVYVFTRSGAVWSQQAYVKAGYRAVYSSRNPPCFGCSVALSADGATLAVGTSGEYSAATGSGAVFVFTRSAGAWSQQASVNAGNTGAGQFGTSVVLSADGNTMAVGAAGVFYVFNRNSAAWSLQAQVASVNTLEFGLSGRAAALTADGSMLAVGGYSVLSVPYPALYPSNTLSGAVYLY